MLKIWHFPESLIAAVSDHQDYQRDSINGLDLVDIVQVVNLQSTQCAVCQNILKVAIMVSSTVSVPHQP
jgi:HD-like signal output (HDOD) protein